MIDLLIDLIVKAGSARASGVVKGRQPSFGLKEGAKLQVKIIPLCVKPVKFGWVCDVTGLEMLVVVFKNFC